MEGIIDDALRRGDSEALSKLPQIPPKIFTNLRLAPIPQMTVQQEAPQKGASNYYLFLSFGLNLG
jgi:hypothetical protein